MINRYRTDNSVGHRTPVGFQTPLSPVSANIN